jgi:hypothetical protein
MRENVKREDVIYHQDTKITKQIYLAINLVFLVSWW